MSKRRGNFEYNYPKVIEYLKNNDIDKPIWNAPHQEKNKDE